MRIALFTLLPIFFATGFWFFYKRNKMSLIPSYFLSFLLISTATLVMSHLYIYLIDNGNIVLRIFFVIILLLLVFIIAFGIYALIFILLSNAYILLKKERRSLSHALTLILAICFISFSLFTHFEQHIELPDYIQVFIYAGCFIFLFYFTHIVHYIIASIIVNFAHPKYDQQYIIVNGSGLINGKVTPLLAGRIDKAILFYNKQKKIYYAPKLILSGGQGADEPVSEASAMMKYASSKGIPESDIILEQKSKTTLENMIFSKEIMDKQNVDNKPYNCIFSTNNYHLLRTGMYARVAGLKIDGIGSKTAWYYLPNALIREYIAYVVMHKKRHLIFVLVSFLCGFLTSMALLINGWI
jgi:uncharacterized SAM-binding protein YcdF (DUF218 family)